MRKAIKSGKINLMGVELECVVLDNGQRVITDESMRRFGEALQNGFPDPSKDAMEYLRFMNSGELPGED